MAGVIGEVTICRETPADPELGCEPGSSFTQVIGGITLEEWLDFVVWSDQLAMVDLPMRSQSPALRLIGLSHPVWCLNGAPGWLYWTTGEIHARDPDRALLEVMIETAERLGARVRDSEGWYYLTVDERVKDARDVEDDSSNAQRRRLNDRARERASRTTHWLVVLCVTALFAASAIWINS